MTTIASERFEIYKVELRLDYTRCLKRRDADWLIRNKLYENLDVDLLNLYHDLEINQSIEDVLKQGVGYEYKDLWIISISEVKE